MKKSGMFVMAALLGCAAAVLPAAAADAASTNVYISIQGGDAHSRHMDVGRSTVSVNTRVTINARGLPPFKRLVASVGRSPSDLMALRSVRADERGRVSVSLEIPGWARPGRSLVFALQTSGGHVVAISSPIRIAGGYDDGGNDDVVTVSGVLLDPVAECPRIAGDDGRIYALDGDLRQFDTGDHVRVTGELAGASICNARRTIEVERIRDDS